MKRASRKPSRGRLDVVVPVFNEADALPAFQQELAAVLGRLDYAWRVIFVDDGSSDATPQLLRTFRGRDRRMTWLRLSRNFGYQAALTAGLDAADADVVAMMDGDGQHPPAVLPEMVKLIEAGYDIVATSRIEAEGVGLRHWPRRLFYRVLNLLADTKVIPGVTDFRLMRRAAVEALRQMPERHRYLRGMVAWMGFRSVVISFSPSPRQAGQSKWTFRGLLRLAGQAILSFSLVPLSVGLIVGLLFLLFAMCEALYVVSLWLAGRGGEIAPGWSSLMFVLLIVGSSLMVMLSIVGIYAGLTYQEVKRRPVYLVQEAELQPSAGAPPSKGAKHAGQ
jgi:dolichol-phosphate mannosyltransferase